MKLTARQQRFVDEYLLDLNGTQAVVRAGYSVNGADVQAAQLLGNPRVKAAVDRAIANRANRVQVRQDDVLRELLRVAMADPAKAFGPDGDVRPIHEIPEDVRRAISGCDFEQVKRNDGSRVTIGKLKFWDKLRALEVLSRHLGLLRDSPEENERRPVFNLVINGIRPKEKELPIVDAKALPASVIQEESE